MRVLKILDWIQYKERRIFYIEVGNIKEGEVDAYIRKIQNQLKKKPTVDPKTGNFNMKYDPFNVSEDFYIPVRQAS
jgi:hypothetical protein